MSFCLNFPLFMIVASLVCSVVSTLLDHKFARYLSLTLSFACVVLNAILFVYVLNSEQSFVYLMGHFPHPWGNELKIGLLENLVSLVFSFVLFLILLGGKEVLDDTLPFVKHNLYYCLCDLINASLLVLVYTNDIFTAYVFVEICTLASTGILVIKDDGRSIVAGLRYMVFALIGSGMLLFGIVFLYNITGHLLMIDLCESIKVLWSNGEYHLPLLTAMCFISTGICIKSGLFPFHFWMADTYGSALQCSSGILSGIISKAYIFLLVKIIKNVFTVEIFKNSGIADIVFVLALGGIIIGSVSAIRENNIFKMCAYSSAAQIAYIYMGIGLATKASLLAAIFQLIAHSVTKPALFLSAYRLSKVNDGADKFEHLKGSYKKDVFASLCFSQGALSMIGIPLTAGFMTKYLFGLTAFDFVDHHLYLTLSVLIISTILNTVYFTRTMIDLFSRSENNSTYTKASVNYYLVGVLFVLINFGLGIFSSRFIVIIQKGISLF